MTRGSSAGKMVFIPSYRYSIKEIVMPAKTYKSGEKAPASGQYTQVGPRGGIGREVTAVKGEPLPPTTSKGANYRLTDRTKNKSGKGK